jgi:nicotinate-nucleotide pyrophosphorylase (carboxylating)
VSFYENQKMSFTPSETAACRQLIELALVEDLDDGGDITSQAVIPQDLPGCAAFVARAEGVVAGLPAAALVLEAVDNRLVFQPLLNDGTAVQRGTRLATVAGPMRGILAAERTALNFLQRLSGVATQTAQYVQTIAGLPAQILDTRKTTPGWRLLEKYAVRQGGGHNHRLGLYDGILIKDNHLAALASDPTNLWQRLRAALPVPRSVPVEIEVDTLDQLRDVLPIGPDIVLLDNMTPEQMRMAVALRNRMAPAVQLEASGGISLQTVRAIAETGVDRISVGALTHSAPALDIALDYQSA